MIYVVTGFVIIVLGTWFVCAGKIEKLDTELSVMRRELAEERGFTSHAKRAIKSLSAERDLLRAKASALDDASRLAGVVESAALPGVIRDSMAAFKDAGFLSDDLLYNCHAVQALSSSMTTEAARRASVVKDLEARISAARDALGAESPLDGHACAYGGGS